jgi:hypothetical protein
MTIRVRLGYAALAVVLLTSGCTPAGPAATPPAGSASDASASASPTIPASPTATASPASPLACTDLAGSAAVDTALQATAVAIPFPRAWLAEVGYNELDSYAVTATGGLACAWTTATADSPWLQVLVMPDAPATISPYLYGDAPTSDTRTFGGRTVTASCGDPGCGLTTLVDGTWVDIRLNIPGIGTTGGVLGPVETIWANASPIIESVFAAIDGATPGQLAWPPTSTLSAEQQAARATGAAACEAYLPGARLAPLLGETTATWQAADYPAAVQGIMDVAATRAGFVSCYVTEAPSVRLDLAPGNAWIAADIGTNPRQYGAFVRSPLPGQIDTEDTYSDCVDPVNTTCTAVLALGADGVEVSGTAASLTIAEAITARAR